MAALPDDQPAGRRRRPSVRAYLDALLAFRRATSAAAAAYPLDRPLFVRERPDLVVYGGIALGLVLTALPFLLASADGFVAGLGGVPLPTAGEQLGRAQGLAVQGPLPLLPGEAPMSPLYLWLIALSYVLVGWTGLPIAALAKLWGLALAGVAAAALYNVARTVSGHRWPGILAVALLLLDPVLAFGRVSATEAPLVSALVALTVLALGRGRLRLLAWLAAGLVLARPDGALLVALVLLVLLVQALWVDGELTRDPRPRLAEVARVGVPAALALGAWALYGLSVATHPLPPLAVTADLASGALFGGRALWLELLGDHPHFASGFALILLAAWMWSIRTFLRHWGVVGALPSLIPVLLLLLSLVAAARSPLPAHELRRLVEPALPWLALGLGLGLAAAGDFIWRSRLSGSTISSRWRPDRAVALLPLALWLLSAGLLWARGANAYAWGARNVAEVPMALGLWVAANVPPDALVAVVDGAGPARLTSARAMLSLSPAVPGPNWEATRELAARRDADYLIAPRTAPPAGWGVARELLRASTPRNVVLPASEMALYRLEWGLPRVAPSVPVLLRMDGYVVVDSLDVGDGDSETRHFYAAATRGTPVRGEIGGPAAWTEDDGRAQEVGRGAESFTLAARPGRDLLLGLRYDGTARGTLRFTLGEQPVEWVLRECGRPLCEDAIVLPAGRITAPLVRFEVAFLPPANAPAAARLATYHYWAITRADG